MEKFSAVTIKKTDLYLSNNKNIMAKVIIANVIMAIVTYGKCNL